MRSVRTKFNDGQRFLLKQVIQREILGFIVVNINLLKPNDIYIYIYIYIYICRTAALTSRRYILNIYSTNIHTEYFKHDVA